MATGFGAMCCVYDDETWLPLMLEGCYPAVDKLFFMVSQQPWNGEPSSNEATLAAIRRHPDPDHKILIVGGNWTTEANQRNACLQLCLRAGLDFCAIIDADEIYDPDALNILFETARLQTRYDAWSVAQITYWKSHEYIVAGTGYNGATTIVRVGDVTFVKNRHTTAKFISQLPARLGTCHHLSYARSDEQLLKKLAHFSHARQIRPNWFNEVWRQWDHEPSLENLHPIVPAAFPRAVRQRPQALPRALRLYAAAQTASHRRTVEADYGDDRLA